MDFKHIQAYFFLAVFILALVLSYLVFRPYVTLLLAAGALAILVSPVNRLLTKFFRGNRAFGAFSTVILTLIVLVLPLVYFVVTLATEVVNVYTNLRDHVSFVDVETTLTRLVGPVAADRIAVEASRALANIADYAQPAFASLASNLISLFSNTAGLLLGLMVLLISLYYVLKDGAAIKSWLIDLSPLSQDNDNTIYSRVREAVWAVAYGNFAVALSKGLVGGLTFLALGLQAPVFWGFMIALSSFIPGVGTAVVTVPFAVYLFVTGHFWQGLALALVAILIIGLVDNFLSPQLINTRIHIHPLVALLAILGGLELMGPIGVFFGPVIASVTLALVDIYRKEFRQQMEGRT